jgi:hypothetical protein
MQGQLLALSHLVTFPYISTTQTSSKQAVAWAPDCTALDASACLRALTCRASCKTITFTQKITHNFMQHMLIIISRPGRESVAISDCDTVCLGVVLHHWLCNIQLCRVLRNFSELKGAKSLQPKDPKGQKMTEWWWIMSKLSPFDDFPTSN